MNVDHKDINKFLPFGEALRGFVNQNTLTKAELNKVLRERGIFLLDTDKDFSVPLLQTLILSPREFDKIREAFSTKEDNKKIYSRDIKFETESNFLIPELLHMNVEEFLSKKLPTCKLQKPIEFSPVAGNRNHIKVDFVLERNDLNKSWYEQTNIFEGSVEFIKDENGQGKIIVSHTAIETKDLGDFILNKQVDEYKKKGLIDPEERIKKITFSVFSNEERFQFFFKLTNELDCVFFDCETIRDISIKPEDISLPEEIKWMEELNMIVLSGNSLDKKAFIKNENYHKHLILWNLEAIYKYELNGQEGTVSVNFGFPDYATKLEKAEFELHISNFQVKKNIDTKSKKILKSKLLSEIDKQKTLVYNKFFKPDD